MLKLTKTGIGLLTKQYRSVLMKCLLLNLGLFAVTYILTIIDSQTAWAGDGYSCQSWGGTLVTDGNFSNGADCYWNEKPAYSAAYFDCTTYGCGYYANISNDIGPYSSSDARYGRTILWNSNVYPSMSETEKKIALKYDAQYAKVGQNGKYIKKTYSVAENLQALDDSLNYYYTFRVDEMVEVIEFAKELRSNKKEMSSLDFMPIKSSSDLRINLIKAEDPLTFSAKTRDDSLVLMEVYHA